MKPFFLTTMFHRALALSLATLTYTAISSASVPLPPGSTVALPGTTAAAEPDLAGTVVHEQLIPFTIKAEDGTVLYEGVLENRVVKSTSTGALHFYYRIRDTNAALTGVIQEVRLLGFQQSPNISVDWRSDEAGTVSPVSASRSPGAGANITFNFPETGTTLTGAAESYFFFVKTEEQSFDLKGRIMITLTTGEKVNLKVAAPKKGR